MINELYDLIDRRATCRGYETEPIPGEVLDRLLAAGCKSPSSSGFQCISIVKVTDREKREKLAELSRGQRFVADAPVNLVFCIDYHRMAQVIRQEPAPFRQSGQVTNLFMGIVDATICAQTIALAAEAEGLGSCYNGNILHRMDKVSELLALPEGVCPVIMLTLGLPKGERRRQPPKYPPALLVHDNVYQERPDAEVFEAYREQNGRKEFSLNPQRLEQCCGMARRLAGEEYAQAVRADIEKKGYMGPYQYWLGCYYTDEPGFLTTGEYLDYFKKQGLHWLDTEGEN